MTTQKPCPADGSTERPWTALEAAFEEDGMAWGFSTRHAYIELERRVKANADERRKLDLEWKVMLALENRLANELAMRQASLAQQGRARLREGRD